MSADLVAFVHRDADPSVLVVTNMWPETDRDHYGIFVRRQVDAVRGLGVRCDVVAIRGRSTPLAYLRAFFLLAWWNIRPPARYRLVHAHGGETGVVARAFVRAPLVVSYCGDDLLGTPRPDGSVPVGSRLRRALIRASARLAGRTITKSRELAIRLPAARRATNAVIPNGVDRELFAPADRDRARAALGWPPGEAVALFAADPTIEIKRHSLAEAACAAARAQSVSVRLHVAGGVPPAQMPTLMNAADCLLLTSTHEGSPNVVKEAVMCDLPVITTRVGDVEEILAEVRPSWICPAAPSALGAAIADCLTEPRRSNGRLASDGFASEAIAARVRGVYLAVADLTG